MRKHRAAMISPARRATWPKKPRASTIQLFRKRWSSGRRGRSPAERMQTIRGTRRDARRAGGAQFRQPRRHRMRRYDQRGRAMEADQTKRAQAVGNAGGGARHILLLRWERMEMRGTNRLRKQKNSGREASYSAHPALTICSAIWPGCYLHRIVAGSARASPMDVDNCVGFRGAGQVCLAETPTSGRGYFQPKKSRAQMKWPTPAARAAAASIS